MLQAGASLAWRVVIVRRAAAPIDGRASPRKPSVRIDNRSSSFSFDVACRSIESARSERGMLSPSSLTRISRRPPPSVSTSMRPAPASSAFSTSSFTTLAGRSTTSPAAMRLPTASDNRPTGILRAPDRIAWTLPAHSGPREVGSQLCPIFSFTSSLRTRGPIVRVLSMGCGVWVPALALVRRADGAKLVPVFTPAQALDAGPMLLGLEPLLALGFRHLRRPARRGLHSSLPDEVEEPLARVLAIALLRPVLLRNDDNDAFLG